MACCESLRDSTNLSFSASARNRPPGDRSSGSGGRSGDRKMTMASRMSSGPLSARNGAKAGEIFVSLVIVVVKYVFSIRHILVVQKSCGRRDNDTPMLYIICHMKYGI